MNAFTIRASLATLLFLATASGFSQAAWADDTLYRDFGEKPGLERIVDDLVTNLHADPRTSPYFVGAPEKRIKEKLVEQLCVLLDGPCVYTGRTMKRSHEGIGVTRAAFYALVEDMQRAMDKNNVPFRSQNKLLAKLAPMYRDIEDHDEEPHHAANAQ